MPKRGTDNLIPVRSEDEAREKGKKGGIASGKSRRKKKELRKELEELLSLPVTSDKMLKNLQSVGIPIERGTTLQTAISAAMIHQAANGNVKAFQAIADVIKPTKEEQAAGGDNKLEVIFKIEDTSGGEDEDPADDT